LKRRDGQPALVVGQFDYRATPFQNVLRQSVVSVAEAPLKNGLDNCILDKDWGSRIAICVLHHHVRGHIAGEECDACVLTKAKQIIVDFGILYDAKLLHVLLDVISL
jgi:hypothetical protein